MLLRESFDWNEVRNGRLRQVILIRMIEFDGVDRFVDLLDSLFILVRARFRTLLADRLEHLIRQLHVFILLFLKANQNELLLFYTNTGYLFDVVF